MIGTIIEVLISLVLAFIYGSSMLLLWGMIKEQRPRWRRKKAIKHLEKSLQLELMRDGDKVLLVTKDARVWNRSSISEASDVLAEVFDGTDIKFLMIDGTDWNVTILREKK